MELDYQKIGKRVAERRRELGLTQAQVAERCEITEQYQSNIERAVSIPSVEVLMRLSVALDTTPDRFLVGVTRSAEGWQDAAQELRGLNRRQLELVRSFVEWVSGQEL